MILNASTTNAEIEAAGSLASPAKGVQQQFEEAEQLRQRRRALRLMVLTWIVGIGIVIWALPKRGGNKCMLWRKPFARNPAGAAMRLPRFA